MAPETFITYHRDEEALTIIGHLMDGHNKHGHTLNDISFKLQELEETVTGSTTSLSGGSTTSLSGGSGIEITNDNIINLDFSEFSTDNITEGSTNLFHSDEKVDDRVNNLLQEGSNIVHTYDDVANTFTISTSMDPTFDSVAIGKDPLADTPFTVGSMHVLKTSTTGHQVIIGGSTTNNRYFTFSETGKLGLGNTQDYGSFGQVLTSGGTGAPTWTSLPTITSSTIGLGNVDNTSDANKPVSTAQQTAIDAKEDPLTFNVNVLSTSYPSGAITRTGNTVSYHPAQVPTSGNPENSWSSYATSHDPTFTGTVNGITKTMIGLANVDNTADTAKPVSTAQQTAIDAKEDPLSFQIESSTTYAKGAITRSGNTVSYHPPQVPASGNPAASWTDYASQSEVDTKQKKPTALNVNALNLFLQSTNQDGSATQWAAASSGSSSLPYFILGKAATQQIPDTGGVVDSATILWDNGVEAQSPGAVNYQSNGFFSVGSTGIWHFDITALVGGSTATSQAAKMELLVFVNGVQMYVDEISVYEPGSTTDNILQYKLGLSFLHNFTALHLVETRVRVSYVTNATIQISAHSSVSYCQVSAFKVA